MSLLKHVSAFTLSTLLGLVFVFSAYTKLIPLIEPFEFSFIDLGIANWYSAPIIARLLIGFEFFMGILLVLHFQLRKFTLPLTLLLLLVFTVYLLIQTIQNGDKGNCACFGDYFPMTPIQGILKNIFLMAAAFSLYILSEGWSHKYHMMLKGVLLLTSLNLPFLLNPLDLNYSSHNRNEKINYPMAMDLLYKPFDSSEVEIPKRDLRKGKHILAFLSLSCSHCRVAAKKLQLLKKQNSLLPIYFILNGNKEHYNEFILDSRAENIPSSFCGGKSFVRLAEGHLPSIYYLNNGTIIKKVEYPELDQNAIEKWLNGENQ